MTERFYGYKHWTLENVPRCFNVGRGTRGRAFDKQHRNAKWKNVASKYGVRVEVCTNALSNAAANLWEIEQIIVECTYAGDYPDSIGCNLTRGGEGCTGGKGGRGKTSWSKGKTGVYSKEYTDAISRRQSSNNISKRPDVREKLVEKQAQTNLNISIAHRAKGAEHHCKKFDVREKISRAVVGTKMIDKHCSLCHVKGHRRDCCPTNKT